MNSKWHDLTSLLPETTGWMHSGVALLGDGQLLCAHPEGHALLRINPAGKVSEIPTTLTEMHSIVTAIHRGSEVIAVADPGHRFVPHDAAQDSYTDFTRNGRAVLLDSEGVEILEMQCPALEVYADQSWRPTSIAIDDERYGGSGEIWVADGYGASLLHRFADDGRYLQTIDGAASGVAFACPHGIALTTGGDAVELYVADRGNCRLVVLDSVGSVVRTVGEGYLDSPSSLVFAGDRLFVTELFGSVSFFEHDSFMGRVDERRTRSHTEEHWPNIVHEGVLGAPGHECDAFTSPHGIASNDTHLYLTEWHIGGRLLRLSLDQIQPRPTHEKNVPRP
jgi:hypothetical protein